MTRCLSHHVVPRSVEQPQDTPIPMAPAIVEPIPTARPDTDAVVANTNSADITFTQSTKLPSEAIARIKQAWSIAQPALIATERTTLDETSRFRVLWCLGQARQALTPHRTTRSARRSINTWALLCRVCGPAGLREINKLARVLFGKGYEVHTDNHGRLALWDRRIKRVAKQVTHLPTSQTLVSDANGQLRLEAARPSRPHTANDVRAGTIANAHTAQRGTVAKPIPIAIHTSRQPETSPPLSIHRVSLHRWNTHAMATHMLSRGRTGLQVEIPSLACFATGADVVLLHRVPRDARPILQRAAQKQGYTIVGVPDTHSDDGLLSCIRNKARVAKSPILCEARTFSHQGLGARLRRLWRRLRGKPAPKASCHRVRFEHPRLGSVLLTHAHSANPARHPKRARRHDLELRRG